MNTRFSQVLKKDKYGPINLFIGTYNYNVWFENGESADATKNDKNESLDLSDMLPIESYEEVKERKGVKILALEKLLTRFPILLAQVKAINYSYKLEKKI